MNFLRNVLPLVALCAFGTSLAHAQTKLLNDTGQTLCYDAANVAAACDATTTGNAGSRPHQDGRYGRDANAGATPALSKVGGGAAGFDFSCVLWNGTVINGANCHAGLVANTTGTASATPATDWACTKDNVTGLVWSLQTQTTDWNTATGATYPDAGHNTLSRCGYSSAWRVPSRRELYSIVHFGVIAPPTIDAAHFPSTADYYWTADTYASNPPLAWTIFFNDGYTFNWLKTEVFRVRLVRSGQ
jgi:Protein of unknown function (DUF1566)